MLNFVRIRVAVSEMKRVTYGRTHSLRIQSQQLRACFALRVLVEDFDLRTFSTGRRNPKPRVTGLMNRSDGKNCNSCGCLIWRSFSSSLMSIILQFVVPLRKERVLSRFPGNKINECWFFVSAGCTSLEISSDSYNQFQMDTNWIRRNLLLPSPG